MILEALQEFGVEVENVDIWPGREMWISTLPFLLRRPRAMQLIIDAVRYFRGRLS